MNNDKIKESPQKDWLSKFRINVVIMVVISLLLTVFIVAINSILSVEGTAIDEDTLADLEYIPGKEYASSTANTAEEASVGLTKTATKESTSFTSESAKEGVSAEPSSTRKDEYSNIDMTAENTVDLSDKSPINTKPIFDSKGDLTDSGSVGDENNEIAGDDFQGQLASTDDSNEEKKPVNESIILAVVIEIFILLAKLVILVYAFKQSLLDLFIGVPMDFMSMILGYISALMLVAKKNIFQLLVILFIMCSASLIVCFLCGLLDKTKNASVKKKTDYFIIFLCTVAIIAIPLTSLSWFCYKLKY